MNLMAEFFLVSSPGNIGSKNRKLMSGTMSFKVSPRHGLVFMQL